MADRVAITSLGSLVTPATGDELIITDVSDTTDGANGTTKKITRDNLMGSTLVGLEGVTASAAELNILDGVTSTTEELNKLDGISGDVVDTGSAQTITGAKALNGGWSSTGQGTAGVRRVATQTIATGTFTPISFDTEDWDQGSLFAPTSTTLNLPAGTWAIHGRIQWAGSGVGERILRYYVNGGGTSYGYSRIAPTGFGPYQVSSTIIKQDSAFTLEMYGYQSSGGDLTATAELQVTRLM